MEAQFSNPAGDLTAQPQSTRPFTIAAAWWLIVVLFGWQLALGIPMGLTSYVAGQFNIDLLGLPETLIYIGAFLLTIRYAGRIHAGRVHAGRQQPNGPLDFTPVKAAIFPVIAVGTVALALLLEPLTSVIPMPDWLQKIMEQAFNKNMIWTAVLFAPVLEEVLLRGILLRGLLTQYSPTKAIVWSAVIFGVMHLNPVQAVGGFVLGLPLGWLYYRTRSLWPGIALHFVNNALASVGFLFADRVDMSANTTQIWVANDALYVGLLVGCAGIGYGTYRLLDWMLPRAPTTQPTAPATA